MATATTAAGGYRPPAQILPPELIVEIASYEEENFIGFNNRLGEIFSAFGELIGENSQQEAIESHLRGRLSLIKPEDHLPFFALMGEPKATEWKILVLARALQPRNREQGFSDYPTAKEVEEYVKWAFLDVRLDKKDQELKIRFNFLLEALAEEKLLLWQNLVKFFLNHYEDRTIIFETQVPRTRQAEDQFFSEHLVETPHDGNTCQAFMALPKRAEESCRYVAPRTRNVSIYNSRIVTALLDGGAQLAQHHLDGALFLALAIFQKAQCIDDVSAERLLAAGANMGATGRFFGKAQDVPLLFYMAKVRLEKQNGSLADPAEVAAYNEAMKKRREEASAKYPPGDDRVEKYQPITNPQKFESPFLFLLRRDVDINTVMKLTDPSGKEQTLNFIEFLWQEKLVPKKIFQNIGWLIQDLCHPAIVGRVKPSVDLFRFILCLGVQHAQDGADLLIKTFPALFDQILQDPQRLLQLICELSGSVATVERLLTTCENNKKDVNRVTAQILINAFFGERGFQQSSEKWIEMVVIRKGKLVPSEQVIEAFLRKVRTILSSLPETVAIKSQEKDKLLASHLNPMFDRIGKWQAHFPYTVDALLQAAVTYAATRKDNLFTSTLDPLRAMISARTLSATTAAAAK
jgi:hypothetical protein